MPARRTTASLALGLVALATFGAASPSSAADVQVEFTVSAAAGGLAVSSAAGTDTLSGATTDLLSTASISDTLPAVTVTDNRGALAGNTWTVGVAGTDFVNQSDTDITIPAGNARVYLDVADVVAGTAGGLLGGMLVTGGENNVGTAALGSSAYTLLSGTTAPLLTGSVTFTPTMDVTVPTNAAVGVYRNTVTYTVT